MVESCVKSAGFSADSLLLDRHRSLDSVCLGVHVVGVCAVGCNRKRVLAAMLQSGS